MDCSDHAPAGRHSALSTVIGNLPYSVMVVVGAAIIALSREAFWWAWIGAGGYFVYGILGSFWIILFLCPHCRSYGHRSCASGYGVLSAKLRAKGDPALFMKKFRGHIPIIVPLWIIPPVIGGFCIASAFSWPLVILMGVFVLDAWVILPVLSRSHGCKKCPQRGECPWMRGAKR